MLEPHVPAFKIGSGDINWPEMLDKVASTGKVVILATGASSIGEVQRAVRRLLDVNRKLVLLQCNTNYTGSADNFRHIHLNVLRSFGALFPEAVLGLSDHTPGHATVLGAVALGARVIEKHFTDDTRREGPDHPFSMDPHAWREMVSRTRELEMALGEPDKRVADNERETVVVQRRCLRASADLKAGTVLSRDMIDVLRPAPDGSIPPDQLNRVLGMRTTIDVALGECFRWGISVEKGRD
jgi:N-acetylneuraminate synthase